MEYYKPDQTVSVTATKNGFLVNGETENYVAADVQQLMGIVLAELTNHHQLAAAKQDQEQRDKELEEKVRAEMLADNDKQLPDPRADIARETTTTTTIPKKTISNAT